MLTSLCRVKSEKLHTKRMPLNNRPPKGGSSAEGKSSIIANGACKIVWHVLCMVFLACFDMAEVAYRVEKFLKKKI